MNNFQQVKFNLDATNMHYKVEANLKHSQQVFENRDLLILYF